MNQSQIQRWALAKKLARRIVEAYNAGKPPGFEAWNVSATTLVPDVIVPSIFTPYSIQRTAQLSAFWQSGIVEMNPQFADLATGGGKTVAMPFWVDLSGNSQPLQSNTALETKKITTAQDTAFIHERGDAWSDEDLAGIFAGSDPATAVGDLVGAYWARDMQTMILSQLTGVFGSASMSGNMADIYLAAGTAFTDANYLTASTFLNAQALLGDAYSKLVAIAMHSDVYFNLRKQDLIDFIKPSDQAPAIGTYAGLQIVVDDGMTKAVINSANVYSTYLFGLGAFAYGVGRKDQPIRARPGSTWETEFERSALLGQNIFINRRRFILHPRGVKWNGASIAGNNPTNTELATASNWTRVYENKNVRIVRIRHNINLLL